MKEDLIKLANKLDKLGFYEESDKVDLIIAGMNKIAIREHGNKVYDSSMDIIEDNWKQGKMSKQRLNSLIDVFQRYIDQMEDGGFMHPLDSEYGKFEFSFPEIKDNPEKAKEFLFRAKSLLDPSLIEKRKEEESAAEKEIYDEISGHENFESQLDFLKKHYSLVAINREINIIAGYLEHLKKGPFNLEQFTLLNYIKREYPFLVDNEEGIRVFIKELNKIQQEKLENKTLDGDHPGVVVIHEEPQEGVSMVYLIIKSKGGSSYSPSGEVVSVHNNSSNAIRKAEIMIKDNKEKDIEKDTIYMIKPMKIDTHEYYTKVYAGGVYG